MSSRRKPPHRRPGGDDSGDPFQSEGFREWAARVEADTVPKMASSGSNIAIWSGKMDIKLAVEVGAGILLDKPLIVCVVSGTPIPAKLMKVADRIVEFDDTEPESTQRRIMEAFESLVAEGLIPDGGA